MPSKATDDSIDNLDDSSMFSNPTSKNMGSHSRSFVNLSSTNINNFDNKASSRPADP